MIKLDEINSLEKNREIQRIWEIKLKVLILSVIRPHFDYIKQQNENHQVLK